MPDLPIACTLSRAGMTARLALIDALADGLLTANRLRRACACGCATPPTSSGASTNSSRPSPRAARSWTSRWREDGALVLDISGPPNARPVIDLFFAAEAA
jgi:hypothetical protein